MLPSRAISAINTRLALPNSLWCLTKVCMYSCLSGSCFVNEASIRRPRTATVASTAVTSANTMTMMARWPKISFSSVVAAFPYPRLRW